MRSSRIGARRADAVVYGNQCEIERASTTTSTATPVSIDKPEAFKYASNVAAEAPEPYDVSDALALAAADADDVATVNDTKTLPDWRRLLPRRRRRAFATESIVTADGTVSSELAIAFLNASRSVAPNVAAVYPESVAAALIAVSGDSAAVGGAPEGRYVRKECTGRGQLKVRVDAIER